MQTKYKLPKDVYQTALWIIRGHKRREKKYKQKKDDIINGGGAKYITYKDKLTGEEARAFLPSSHSNQSETEIKARALVALEQDSDTHKMNCVQQALDEVSSLIADSEAREYFKVALLQNINDRRQYPFRNLSNVFVSEKTFYNYKAKFIYLVAQKLELL